MSDGEDLSVPFSNKNNDMYKKRDVTNVTPLHGIIKYDLLLFYRSWQSVLE